MSPAIEDMYMETDEILETSTLPVFDGDGAPELESDDILSRVLEL